MRITRFLPAIGLVLLVLLTGFPSSGQTPKSGGWLTLRLREDLPQGFAINESPTISTMWPAMPCLSNLVLFDPLKPVHSVDTIVGELAERWSWQDSFHKLVFFLRSNVRRGGRRARSTDGRLPAEAAAAVLPVDGCLRVHADLRRARAGGELPHGLRRHGAF